MDCLIVDDEKELAEAIVEYLGMFGVAAAAVSSYQAALRFERPVSVCILDVNLPDGSGYELIKPLREKFPDAKMLFLSARREDFDVLKGYSVGGDDFIVKPCSLPVLLAKVNYALGRTKTERAGDFFVDRENRKVYRGGKEIGLKNLEYKLFCFLFSHRGAVLDKERILKAVWGEGYYTDNTLNVHVNRIREKLDDKDGKILETVWGVGYRFKI